METNKNVKMMASLYAEMWSELSKHPGVTAEMLNPQVVQSMAVSVFISESRANAPESASRPYSGGNSAGGQRSSEGSVRKIRGELDGMEKTAGGQGDRPWTKYTFTVNGNKYSTFDKTIVKEARVSQGDEVELSLKRKGKFENIVKITKIKSVPVEDDNNDDDEEHYNDPDAGELD